MWEMGGGFTIKKHMIITLIVIAISLFAAGCTSTVDDSTETIDDSTGVDEIKLTSASNIGTNVLTSFNEEVESPDIDTTAYIHPLASVIGNVHIGTNVMVSPGASVRGDEGQPIHVGNDSNIQDGVVLHALESEEHGEAVEHNLVEVDGNKYAVYVGDRVSMAHQSHVHGPSKVGDDTFIGMQSFVFKAKVGNNCVLEPVTAVIGVTIPDGRFVPAGTVVTTQAQADALPEVTDDYAYRNTNGAVVHVNELLAEGYNELHEPVSHINANVLTSFNEEVETPDIDPTAYIHPLSSVIGDVHIGTNVMVSPGASVRGDEGQPIHVGDDSNIQDGVVLHALETEEHGEAVEHNLVEVDGNRYAVHIGDRVSLAHQSQVHGPSKVGDDTFIGMQSFVFKAKVGNNCVLEPVTAVIGVTIPDGRFVPAGTNVTTQAQADALSEVTDDYAYRNTNEAVVHVNELLAEGYNELHEPVSHISANVLTSFNEEVESPDLDPTAHIHPLASVIGDVHIGTNVMVSPGASVRGDEGQPIHVGNDSNIQDGVVLHALETEEHGEAVEHNLVEVDGNKYAVYIGDRVSLAHQSQVHGPSKVGDDTFIGMQSFVFKAKVGNNCVLEPVTAVIGVTIPDGRFVPAGTVVTTQAQADALPEVTDDYAYRHTNEAVVHVNEQLAEGYNELMGEAE